MAAQHDMKTATQTYSGFINMFKYGAIAVALVAAFVIFLIH